MTISHYHFDHHTPSFEDWVVNWTEANETAKQIYQGKTCLPRTRRSKSTRANVSGHGCSSRQAANTPKRFAAADGKTFTYGKTQLRFSEPVAHGSQNSMLGWVIMATVEYGDERFMFAPDVQGPMTQTTLEAILKAEPTVVMLGGPPLYLEGFKS